MRIHARGDRRTTDVNAAEPPEGASVRAGPDATNDMKATLDVADHARGWKVITMFRSNSDGSLGTGSGEERRTASSTDRSNARHRWRDKETIAPTTRRTENAIDATLGVAGVR